MNNRFNLTLQIFIASAICISSCKHYLNDEDEGKSRLYNVCFYQNHPKIMNIDPVFEEITLTVITEEYHKADGYTVEVANEQLLVKQAHHYFVISNCEKNPVMLNTFTNQIDSIHCCEYYDVNQIMKIEVPDEYKARSFLKTINIGTGADVPAKYSTQKWYKLKSNGSYIEKDNQKILDIKSFVIPKSQDIHEYIEKQFMHVNCKNELSYKVL